MRLGLAAFFIFVLSLVTLILFAPCREIRIADVPDHVGECVRICGTVIQKYATERACFYTLFDGNTIRAVQFRPYTCMSGDVCVFGRVQIYRGEYEIVVLSHG